MEKYLGTHTFLNYHNGFAPLVLLLLTLLLPQTVLAAWYDNNWTYRKQIDISAAMTPNTQSNFPVLISFATDSSLSTNAQIDGDDILFTSSDGTTKLSHEIETYTTGTGELAAWVKIPSLSGLSDTTIYMYYGYSSAGNQESVSTTWDNNFKAVWHLAENPAITTDGDCGGGSKEICDSTANNNDADTVGTTPTVITAQIENGLDLDGTETTGGYLAPPIGNGLDITGTQITLEGWVRLPVGGVDNDEALINKLPVDLLDWTDYPYMLGVQTLGNPTLDGTNCRVNTSGGGVQVNVAVVPRGAWVYLVCRYDGSNVDAFVDNSLITSSALTGTINTGSEIRLGARRVGRRYEGDMDELRISNIVRSDDWLTTTYNNQNSPGTYLTTNSAETQLVTGSIYSDEGTTKITTSTQVRLVVNGISAGTDTTTTGDFSIASSTVLNAGDNVLVYLDDAASNGNTITVSGGSSLSGLDIYADHIITRHDNSGNLTNALMKTALGAYSDTGSETDDILYSVDGSNILTANGAGVELFIPNTHTFAPGANINVHDVDINGTVIASSNTFSVSGDWEHTTGTFNSSTSTVDFTGSGTISIDITDWWSKSFYNVNAAAAGQTTTILAGKGINVKNILTVGIGTVAGGTIILGKNGGTPLVTSGATLSNVSFKYNPSSNPVNITSTSYPSLWIASNSISNFTLLGDINCTSLLIFGNGGNDKSTLDTAGHSITCDQLLVGRALGDTKYGKLILNNSVVTINGDVDIYTSAGGDTNEIDAGSATITVSGDWTNNDTFTAGTSTVTFNGSVNQTITPNNNSFNNLTLNNTGSSGTDNIIINGALDINGTLAITDGDLDISTNNPIVNTAGSVSIGAAGSIDVSSRTTNWTFDGISTLIDSSAGQDFEDVILNGTNLTLGSNTKVQTMTVTTGTLNLGNSGYILEIDGTGTPLSNNGTFIAGTSTVKYTGSGVATNIATLPYSSLHLAPTSITTYSLTGDHTGVSAMTGNLTVDANATLETTSANNYNITMSGNFEQSSSTSQMKANSSTITVGGNFTADGSITGAGSNSIGFNSASLILTSSGELTYNNVSKPWYNGFNNLTTGQSGNTTSLNNTIAVLNLLTVGSGTFTGPDSQSVYLRKAGTPLAFDSASTISVPHLKFFGLGNQTIPPLNNGYDSNIALAVNSGKIITQGDNITINAGKNLTLMGDGSATRSQTYNTNGFDLNVGGDIRLGFGGDTGIKTLNISNSNVTVSGNIDIRTGTNTLTSTNSTVTLNSVAAQTVLSSGNSFNNLAITNTSTAGVSFLDALTTTNFTNTTAASKLTFKAGTTHTVSGTLTLDGTSSNEIILQSDSGGTRFTLDVSGAAQTVSYLKVTDSEASTNDITANNSTSVSNNDDLDASPHWIFTKAISGTVYTDEASALIGDGAVIRLIVNGTSAGTYTTAGGTGQYSITPASLNAGDKILVYVDGFTTDGTTMTISDGNILAGFDIYGAHVIVRNDNGSTTNSIDMKTAEGGYGDPEILYGVDASNNLTVEGADTEFYLPAGHTYTASANVTAQHIEINGTMNAGGNTFNLTGGWDNNNVFNAGTSTVNFIAGSGTELFDSTGASVANFYNITFNDAGGTATYQLESSLNVSNDLTVTDGILDTKSGSNYAINVGNDFLQPGGQVQARSSTLTVARHFTADGNESPVGYNSASLVMSGIGSLTYNNLPSSWANGFLNLTGGQSGNTTTISSRFGVINILTVGSGTLTGSQSTYLSGNNPLSFDVDSTVSISQLRFRGIAQTIPPLLNGYDCDIQLNRNNLIVTQSGDITINSGHNLELNGITSINRSIIYNTAGYNLTIDGDILLGEGNDTALKRLDITNSTVTVGGNIDVRSIGSGSVQADFISTGSTVIINGSASQTITVNGSDFNNLTVTNASASGITFTDGFTTNNLTNTTASSKMTFAAEQTYTIDGAVTLNGASGQLLTLASSSPGTYWNFVLNAGATKAIDYVSVSWSDASGSHSTQKLISPTNSDDGGNNIDWFGSTIIGANKTSTLVSDPVNGTGAGKNHIPGAIVEYSITTTNTGGASPDADTIIVYDVVDSSSVEYDVTTGVTFADGTTSSALALGTVSYSHASTPTIYTYSPTGSYDPDVAGIKVETSGTFAFGGTPAPGFTLKYRVRIK